YDYIVQYLRALFVNSELRSFACQVNLYVLQLFLEGVTLSIGGGGKTAGGRAAGDGGDNKNIIVIKRHYQTQGGNDSVESVYSFVSDKPYAFSFADNKYLDNITLTKLQFSIDTEGAGKKVDHGTYTSTTRPLTAHFGIWGSIKFKKLDVLDVFSIDK